MTNRLIGLAAGIVMAGCAFVASALADYDVQVDLKNVSGQVKTDWPVVLKVYTVLGRNLPAGSVNTAGFHVFDPAGKEAACALETIPPYDVPGNDEIIFVVPRMEAAQTLSYRIVNNKQPGPLAKPIHVVDSPHNLIANGGAEKAADGAVEGFAGGGVDTAVKHSGAGSLRITADGGSATVKLAKPIKLNKGSWYYFGAWSKTDNVARFGYDTGNGGGHFKFEYTNPATTKPADKPLGNVMGQCFTRDWLKCTFEGGRDAWGMDRYVALATADEATMEFVLNQPKHYYFETGKGKGAWWLDNIVLMEQPEVNVRFDLALEKVVRDGLFLFTRQPEMPLGKLQETEKGNIYKRLDGDKFETIWVQMPFAHEKLQSLDRSVLKGQRASFCVGLYHTRAVKDVTVAPTGLALSGPGGVKIAVETVEYCPGYLGISPSRYMPVVGTAEGVQPVNPSGDKGVRYFFVTFAVPRDAAAGRYAGDIEVKADGKLVQSVPVSLRVQDLVQPVITDTYVGLIYNGGLPDINDMLKQYARSGFTQIMWFHGWIPWVKGPDGKYHIDMPKLDEKMKYMRSLGLAGCGLYSDIQLDDKPRGPGRLVRMAREELAVAQKDLKPGDKAPTEKDCYARLIREIGDAAKAHPDWPRFIHMNWDEPPPVNEKMGWTNEILGPEAITTLDVQFGRLPGIMKYYNTPAFDDPADWTGPEVINYVKKAGKDFGLCGATDTAEANRYQAGLFIAATGCRYFHAWHIRGGHTPGQMDYDQAAKRTIRGHEMIAWAGGMDDLKAHRLLTGATASARKSGRNAQAVAAAEEFLARTAAVFNGDHRKTWSLQPFLGPAWSWGYEQFYDDWQEQACKHAAAVAGAAWVGR